MGLNIDKAYVGSSEVDKIYLGTNLVWQALEPGIPVEGAPNGVYILHTNGTLYTREQWNTSYNQDVVGVALVTDNCRFVIDKNAEMALTWGGSGTIVDNIVTTTINDDAKKDFKGLNNTEEIISQLGGSNASAAQYCKTSSFPNNKNGYLGSLGEWVEAYNNKSEIDSCISLVGGMAISTARGHWTSTQRSSTAAWFIHWSNGSEDFYSKGSSSLCRAFAPLT